MTEHWIEQDRRHCWHPFTPQSEWTSPDNAPLMIASGDGVWLTDTKGNRYIDGNASIWTNIHGHAHPVLNAAIESQLQQVAHTSYLGFAHPLASELATRLCGFFPENTLERCFFSDDGSTAIEVAMKMSLQSRMQSEAEERTGFICFHNAYHGDTMGAASLGGVSLFFDRFSKLGLPVQRLKTLADLQALPQDVIDQTTALIIEPIIQGVNQMTPWPAGMLRDLRAWTTEHGIHLILDEVMTGFGRTGTMFASQQEEVIPDFLCLAKGLTGGYMPMAATLTTNEVYETFLGPREHAFYYGHSYTANPLGCAVAMASLDLFEQEQTLSHVQQRAEEASALMGEILQPIPYVYEIRQVGLIIGIEIRHPDGSPYEGHLRLGSAICRAAQNHGFLTRPILDTIVLLPPLCITSDEIQHCLQAIKKAIYEVCDSVDR